MAKNKEKIERINLSQPDDHYYDEHYYVEANHIPKSDMVRFLKELRTGEGNLFSNGHRAFGKTPVTEEDTTTWPPETGATGYDFDSQMTDHPVIGQSAYFSGMDPHENSVPNRNPKGKKEHDKQLQNVLDKQLREQQEAEKSFNPSPKPTA